ncbi:MAG: signal peptidase I [Sedimentisphaerales bacterium]|nr:signal peptidase I [Sedimentisphaerales bacterium]
MPSKNSEIDGQDKLKRKKKDRAKEIADTFEWLITAFILAFVFRAFVMEAFRIPTGSMADTLKGAHFRYRCPECGYQYDYGFVPSTYHMAEDTVPLNKVPSQVTMCPSCGYRRPGGDQVNVANGDRILVLKCIYQFLGPKRWDVVVFKNPAEPPINYIKRLIALPGEQVQIIDGDIYINGQIQRKPPKVQNELWMTVYDNDYQPVNPSIPSYNMRHWKQPFVAADSSLWKQDKYSPAIFHLDSPEDKINSLVYDTSLGNDFKAVYAYNDLSRNDQMPLCSDLMMRFYVEAKHDMGSIGVSLGKYQSKFKGWIDFKGEMIITRNDEKEPLASKIFTPISASPGKLTEFKFANVDHMLVLEFGEEKLTYDLGCNREDAGQIKADIAPTVEIFGSGKITLSHMALFRDIHYTTARFGNGIDQGWATDKPFLLNEDEFFVLGDNSPNSEDCRWWQSQGLSNKGLPQYRAGIVPRDYLVGKALFVYWPSGFRPYDRFPFGIIPNVGQMRLIYGGSGDLN